jgi:SPP1 family predicted phage head-tail adaptor
MQTFVAQSRTQTDDGIGGLTATWTDAVEFNGYLDLVTGTDLNNVQNAYTEDSTHVLVIPKYRDELTDNMRVVDASGRFYHINYVDNPVGMNHHIELYLTFGGVVDE